MENLWTTCGKPVDKPVYNVDNCYNTTKNTPYLIYKVL